MTFWISEDMAEDPSICEACAADTDHPWPSSSMDVTDVPEADRCGEDATGEVSNLPVKDGVRPAEAGCDLQVKESHDLQVEESHDLQVEKPHDLQVEESHDLQVGTECCIPIKTGDDFRVEAGPNLVVEATDHIVVDAASYPSEEVVVELPVEARDDIPDDILRRYAMFSAIMSGDCNVVDHILAEGHIGPNSTLSWTQMENAGDANADITESLGLSGCEHFYFQCGYYPLHVACLSGWEDIVELLIRRGAHVNEVANNGESALHLACKCCHLECVGVLIQHGADVNLQHDLISGDTPLLTTVACYNQRQGPAVADTYYRICQALLDVGCDVNLGDNCLSPLHWAAMKTDVRLTSLLVSRGAALEARGQFDHRTPLLTAIAHGQSHNALALIAAGTRTSHHALCAESPLELSLDNDMTQVALELLRAEDAELAKPQFLHTLLQRGRYVYLLLLISCGCDVNALNPYDRASLLLVATRKQDLGLVRLLLRWGADPDLDDRLGTSPLWAAAKLNAYDIVVELVRWGCELNTPSMAHRVFHPLMPVQVALQLRHWDIAKLLLVAGCLFKAHWLRDPDVSRHVVADDDMTSWMTQWMTTVRSLSNSCVITIRKRLGQNLPRKVKKLKLPGKLKNDVVTLAVFA